MIRIPLALFPPLNHVVYSGNTLLQTWVHSFIDNRIKSFEKDVYILMTAVGTCSNLHIMPYITLPEYKKKMYFIYNIFNKERKILWGLYLSTHPLNDLAADGCWRKITWNYLNCELNTCFSIKSWHYTKKGADMQRQFSWILDRYCIYFLRVVILIYSLRSYF